MGDAQTPVPVGGGLSPSGLASRGRSCRVNVEEGVEEEVPDALPVGGCLDKDGRPDALSGARGVDM